MSVEMPDGIGDYLGDMGITHITFAKAVVQAALCFLKEEAQLVEALAVGNEMGADTSRLVCAGERFAFALETDY